MASPEVAPNELPRYLAFRAWRTVPVIARIESCRAGRLSGYCFSKITPEGSFRELPVGSVVFVESNAYAEQLIALIRAGKDLPDEFVQKLHVID
jgi:hypothetical protein